jgi:hypothetical protein
LLIFDAWNRVYRKRARTTGISSSVLHSGRKMMWLGVMNGRSKVWEVDLQKGRV